MPFAAAFPTEQAIATARKKHPTLARLLHFYQELWRVQEAVRPDGAMLPAEDAAGCRERLMEGKPLLRFEQLPLEPSSFGQLLHDLGAVIRRHNPRLLGKQEWANLSIEEWLALAQEVFEDPSLWLGQRDDLDAPVLLVGLALVPYLKWAAGIVGPAVEDTLWMRPYCPVCGGYPDLATLGGEGGARQLMCSRCDTMWSYRRVGCPFCRKEEGQVYYAGEQDRYRLYVCLSCRRYLKTLDLRRASPDVDLRIERIITVAMDLAAQQQGYGVQRGGTDV